MPISKQLKEYEIFKKLKVRSEIGYCHLMKMYSLPSMSLLQNMSTQAWSCHGISVSPKAFKNWRTWVGSGFADHEPMPLTFSLGHLGLLYVFWQV